MKYIITRLIDGKLESEDTDDIVEWCQAAGVEITGKNDSPYQHAYLQGQPILKGFAGPLGSEGDVRYEDWESNKIMST